MIFCLLLNSKIDLDLLLKSGKNHLADCTIAKAAQKIFSHICFKIDVAENSW
jgi:hypothetical protein